MESFPVSVFRRCRTDDMCRYDAHAMISRTATRVFFVFWTASYVNRSSLSFRNVKLFFLWCYRGYFPRPLCHSINRSLS